MELLALGSIVELKNMKDKVLIIGVNQMSGKEKYDYIGCTHPYGYMSVDELLVFNKDAIKNVIFNGYFDDESKEFYEDIEWLKEREKKNG